jgi:hypothetical protein
MERFLTDLEFESTPGTLRLRPAAVDGWLEIYASRGPYETAEWSFIQEHDAEAALAVLDAAVKAGVLHDYMPEPAEVRQLLRAAGIRAVLDDDDDAPSP